MSRRHVIDLLIVCGAIVAAVDEPAAALVFLPLLVRDRFPVAAPAAVWVYASALSFADGRIIPTTLAAMLAGMAAAFLLGQRSLPGLAVVLGGAAIVEFNNPAHTQGDMFF